MANVIKLRRSAVSGNNPTTSHLELGEVALNTFDGNLFFKKDQTSTENGVESIVQVVTTDGTQSLSNKTLESPSVSGTLSSSDDIVGSRFLATNNGNGQNFKVGDDIWIGDVNIANLMNIRGVQDPTQGYISFGSSSNTKLGRTGTGDLTWDGQKLFHAGNTGTGSGLDADLLDGHDGSYYASLTGSQTLTNKTLDSVVLTGTITANGSAGGSGYILTSTGSGVQWAPNAASTLDGLSDVVINNPQAQEVLKYNGSNWINAEADVAVASAVFAPQAQSDLGLVSDALVLISEDLGLVADIAQYVYDMGQLRLDGIVSLSNIDQSVKADYIGYSIIFGF